MNPALPIALLLAAAAAAADEPASPGHELSAVITADFDPAADETAVEQVAAVDSVFASALVFPDRSRPTPRIETVPDGRWMTEAGFLYAGTSVDLTWSEDFEPELNVTQLDLLVRRGIGDNVEARFFAGRGDTEFAIPTLVDWQDPFTTVGAGLKMRLCEGAGWKPDVSLLGDVGFGRNELFADSDEVLWNVLGIARWSPRPDTNVGLSLGLGNPTVVDEYEFAGTVSLFAERFWTDRCSTFGDFSATGGLSRLAFGLVANVTERVFVDLSGGYYGIGIDGAEEAFGAENDVSGGGFVSAGASVLW